MVSNRSVIFNLVITAIFALYFFFHQDLDLLPTGEESPFPIKLILKGIGWIYLLNVVVLFAY